MLLFLAIMGDAMQLPAWLQVTGRMHPLVVHFPIVMLIVAIVLEWRRNDVLQEFKDIWLGLTAIGAACSALAGLFLSKEGGYQPEVLSWHQWTGVGVSAGALIWWLWRNQIRSKSLISNAFSLSLLGLVVLAGHKGATLTHGDNYLLEPMFPSEQIASVPKEDALVFQHVVKPILEKKCISCHNAGKLKGDLNLETEASILKGGKNGPLWDPNAPDFGLLLRRIHLPVEEKEHMPPKGKSPLDAEELAILNLWIRSGSSFTTRVQELPEGDTLRLLSESRLQTSAPLSYPFEAAAEKTIQSLNSEYRAVYPLAIKSPALGVSFYGVTAFRSEALKELQVVQDQIVELDLNQMPVKDEDLATIAMFKQLSKLNLASTSITGNQLSALKGLQNLQELVLSRTPTQALHLEFISSLPGLKKVYVWNTGITSQDLEVLRRNHPAVQFMSGYTGEGVVAKLNAPIIESGSQVFIHSTKVKLKNYINGAQLRYTLDGSQPDSLQSLLYTGDSITINQSCELKARAFLPGWVSSETSSRSFYTSGIVPDSVVLRFPPNPQYKALGPKSLSDQKIGDTDFRTNKWLGYKETPFEALFLFNQPTQLHAVSFSTMIDIGSYIMPATELQVWGGMDPKSLKLLKQIRPEQPQKVGMPGYKKGFILNFPEQKVRCLKLVAIPVSKLPEWHPGKRDKGWVFIDEIFAE
jgi:uncharacterized membrane protein